jgi:hypothetical protein
MSCEKQHTASTKQFAYIYVYIYIYKQKDLKLLKLIREYSSESAYKRDAHHNLGLQAAHNIGKSDF